MPKDPVWKLLMASVMVEQKGFDGVWVSDHYFNRSSFMTLSLMAMNTRKVLLGPAVVNPYTTPPALIAQNILTLSEVAVGRVRLAIGAGDQLALKKLGIAREKPVEKVVQAVEAVKQILSASSSTVAVYVGAQGKRMVEASTKAADGVLVNWSSLEKLKKTAELLRQTASNRFRKAAYVITSVHEDEPKARKTAIPYAAYLMTGTSAKHLEEMGIDEDFRRRVENLLNSGSWEELYRASSGEWVDQFAFWGSSRKLEEFSAEVLGMGYDEVVYAGPLGPRYLHALNQVSLICRRLRREMAGVG
ncbi:MAG: LLM class flavin-dependent oxidoreductase [Candidatus Caldarchaeum sp.]